MARNRTIIVQGLQEGKQEEEIKNILEELKVTSKEKIEKVQQRLIANNPWYFVTFKTSGQRDEEEKDLDKRRHK